MTTTRLLCIENTSTNTGGTSGALLVPPAPLPALRAYTANRGQVIDVPGDPTGDAAVLLNYSDPNPGGGKYFALIGQSGTTAARPTSPTPGMQFVDTTAAIVVAWDGANWRNVVSGAIA
jgi:hypothetical protein